MKRVVTIFLLMLSATVFFACGGGAPKPSGADNVAQQSEQVAFQPPVPPALLSKEQQQAYMVEHYWDTFDFSDSVSLSKIDTQQLLTAFTVYVAGYLNDSNAAEPMRRLMERASASRQMFDFFMQMAEFVLHNPNSQYRSDEKYIPVLEVATTSPLYDQTERMPYEYDLHIARQNRVGQVANDFRYTLASGESALMSSIKAEYLLIFISNPGCAMCRDVREGILSSAMLGDLIEQGRLKILVLYPDEDLVAWRQHLGDYPSQWINAYDKGMKITSQRLYDLKAIPSLYLLDENKRVLAKDVSDVREIEYKINQYEQRSAR